MSESVALISSAVSLGAVRADGIVVGPLIGFIIYDLAFKETELK